MNLTIENLKKTYGEKTVLHIPHFALQTGCLCGMIGSNGAGKSTLLNMIAAIDSPSTGTVFYGNPPTASPPLDQMTMVFQQPYMLSTSVEKNIAYPLKLRGWSLEKIEARISLLMEELGLTDLRKQKAWKLSGGETQKVALARALSFYPKLLLLDEPTANIDPIATSEIEAMLKKINREERTTVIIITHNLSQAKRLCDWVAFLHQGHLIEFNETETLLTHPTSPLTQKFIAGELLI
ncbi:MAG: ATP-binding cassette domain-containing protein [Anaerovorax sp.]